jgi:hypothetical protein
MSYRCGKCDVIVPINTQMKRVVKHRMVKALDSERVRQEIESETPVCEECYTKHKESALAEFYGKG